MTSKRTQVPVSASQGTSEATSPRLPLGFSATDLFEAVQREVTQLLRDAKGDQGRAAKLAMERLRRMGHVTQYDLECFDRVISIVMTETTDEADLAKTTTELGDLYYKMLADVRASSAATTTVGVVFQASRSGFGPEFKTLVLFGAFVGFAIGAAAGNPFAGASIGGVVAGVVAKCVGKN